MLLRLSHRPLRYAVAVLLGLTLTNCSQTDSAYNRARSETGLLEWQGVHELLRTDFPNVPTVTTDQLAEALTTERPVVLLDVRDPSEFLVSHLQNARLVRSADDLVTSLENISQDTLCLLYTSDAADE